MRTLSLIVAIAFFSMTYTTSIAFADEQMYPDRFRGTQPTPQQGLAGVDPGQSGGIVEWWNGLPTWGKVALIAGTLALIGLGVWAATSEGGGDDNHDGRSAPATASSVNTSSVPGGAVSGGGSGGASSTPNN